MKTLVVLDRNGLSMKDVKVVSRASQASANGMFVGTEGIDLAMACVPEAGKIIATKLDHPTGMDAFGASPPGGHRKWPGRAGSAAVAGWRRSTA